MTPDYYSALKYFAETGYKIIPVEQDSSDKGNCYKNFSVGDTVCLTQIYDYMKPNIWKYVGVIRAISTLNVAKLTYTGKIAKRGKQQLNLYTVLMYDGTKTYTQEIAQFRRAKGYTHNKEYSDVYCGMIKLNFDILKSEEIATEIETKQRLEKETAERQEAFRLSQPVTITVEMWEKLTKKIRFLEKELDSVRQTADNAYGMVQYRGEEE